MNLFTTGQSISLIQFAIIFIICFCLFICRNTANFRRTEGRDEGHVHSADYVQQSHLRLWIPWYDAIDTCGYDVIDTCGYDVIDTCGYDVIDTCGYDKLLLRI